MTPVAN